jgi:hypothetical protein
MAAEPFMDAHGTPDEKNHKELLGKLELIQRSVVVSELKFCPISKLIQSDT